VDGGCASFSGENEGILGDNTLNYERDIEFPSRIVNLLFEMAGTMNSVASALASATVSTPCHRGSFSGVRYHLLFKFNKLMVLLENNTSFSFIRQLNKAFLNFFGKHAIEYG